MDGTKRLIINDVLEFICTIINSAPIFYKLKDNYPLFIFMFNEYLNVQLYNYQFKLYLMHFNCIFLINLHNIKISFISGQIEHVFEHINICHYVIIGFGPRRICEAADIFISSSCLSSSSFCQLLCDTPQHQSHQLAYQICKPLPLTF